MQLFTRIDALREFRNECRMKQRRVALVPTMGYLHEGHLSLARLAAASSDVVIVSIFVNPTQFNNPADLATYPRDLKRDLDLLEKEDFKIVFAPHEDELYAEGFQSWVNVARLTETLEGAHRPGHFQGVATVVSMLFNAVAPDAAVFGEKDFQQLRVIEQLVKDLKFPVEIIRAPIVREDDGLALSSRNVRLSPEERSSALLISKGLFEARALFQKGERNGSKLTAVVHSQLSQSPLIAPEYVELVREDDLTPIAQAAPGARILLAATVGKVRLIDNLSL
ncbi:MAG: pantoate--beta-alanine ligase [Deltaproteobacteria bacterium]|nr:pantoate--beta-alanine ligase [Deltaproteobacteria bacterium]